MASTENSIVEGTNRIIDSARDAEQLALEAVRKFVDTVDGIFPDISQDAPRRKIIDSAFKMTEQLVGVSHQFAQKVVKATSEVLTEPGSATGSAK
jgi:hypothetical protein